MAKFYGNVGFVHTRETSPDVYEEYVTEKPYRGDEVRSMTKWNFANKVNDDIEVSNEISIVADPYANENLYAIKYVWWMGTMWKVKNITVNFPRLTLQIGGVYNGKGPET